MIYIILYHNEINNMIQYDINQRQKKYIYNFSSMYFTF